MEIRRVPIDELSAAEYNPRIDLQPGDPEYEKLKRSIEEFGYVDPIIWNEYTGNVVGGHQRLKVLQASGETEVDVSVVNLPIEQEKALNIALNKVNGEWDRFKLDRLIRELAETDIDLELTGFDGSELDEIINGVSDIESFFGDIEQAEEDDEDELDGYSCKVTIIVTSPEDAESIVEYCEDKGFKHKVEEK